MNRKPYWFWRRTGAFENLALFHLTGGYVLSLGPWSRHVVARTKIGPKIARRNTYAADTGPSCGSRPDPNPAMMMENSPRAIRAVPARRHDRRSRPALHPAQ